MTNNPFLGVRTCPNCRYYELNRVEEVFYKTPSWPVNYTREKLVCNNPNGDKMIEVAQELGYSKRVIRQVLDLDEIAQHCDGWELRV